jgi:hypothetical protein
MEANMRYEAPVIERHEPIEEAPIGYISPEWRPTEDDAE